MPGMMSPRYVMSPFKQGKHFDYQDWHPGTPMLRKLTSRLSVFEEMAPLLQRCGSKLHA